MKFAVALLIALLALGGCKTDATSGSGGNDDSVFSGQGEEGCARRGGLWVEDGGLFRCILQTGEGTKSCTSGRDCKGECLAASKTCSPFEPLVGCTEVISDGGLLQKLCN
jgi:hypothetical protein